MIDSRPGPGVEWETRRRGAWGRPGCRGGMGLGRGGEGALPGGSARHTGAATRFRHPPTPPRAQTQRPLSPASPRQICLPPTRMLLVDKVQRWQRNPEWNRGWLLRLWFRCTVVAAVTFLACLVPFFGVIVGLSGALSCERAALRCASLRCDVI